MMAEVWGNAWNTTLDGAIDDNDTELTVVDTPPDAYATGDYMLMIEGELLRVTGVSTKTLTVARGEEDTAAAAHDDGASVRIIDTAGSRNRMLSDCFLSGTYANLPAARDAGRVYLCTDSPFVLYNVGGEWIHTIPGCGIVTPPVLGDFTWVNQGSATAVSTYGGVYMEGPQDTGANERVLKKALPSAPWTVTVGFIPMATGVNYVNGGFYLADANDKGVRFAWMCRNAPTVDSAAFNSPTSWSSDKFSYIAECGTVLFLRFVDDNSSRYYQVSRDNQHFTTVSSESRTTHMTPTYCGMMVNAWNSVLIPKFHFVHWAQS